MKSIKTRIFTDLFVAPSTIIPTFIGFTSFALGFAIGSSTVMFMGMCSILAAMGAGFWRFMFNMKEVQEKATKFMEKKKLKEKQVYLDDLDNKLKKDKDKRTQSYLRDLRGIYESFIKDVNKGKLNVYITSTMINELSSMFDKCVSLLEYSHELWESSKSLSDSTKQEILESREEIVQGLGDNVKTFAETVSGLRALALQDRQEEATEIQKVLSKQLKIATETQTQMKNLTKEHHLDKFLNLEQ